MSNLHPVSFPGLVAAMVESMASIDTVRAEKGLPLGLSEARWRVLECIAEHHPKRAPFAALRLCSGLNYTALNEHLRALRWRGLVMFDSNTLSPSAMATVEAYRANIGQVQKRIETPKPEIKGRTGFIIVDESTSFTSERGDPADAPACMRPDCTLINFDRGSLAEKPPTKGAELCHPVAADGISDGDIAVTQVRILPPVKLPITASPPGPVRTIVVGETGAAADAPAAAPVNPPRISAGACISVPPWRGRDVVAERAARLAAAIAHLKGRAVIVDVVDRDATERTYRVSGKRDAKYAEEVVEIAMDLGWTG